MGFVGGFDGFRGVGILCVMVEHANIGKFRSFAGILDMFFVISGFLITTLLLQEHAENGGISLRKFYARRAVRLLPSLWLMIAVTTALTAIFAPDQLWGIVKESLASFFYVYHLVFPVGLDLFHDLTDSDISVANIQMWSLSVEEQFYMIVAVAAIFMLHRNLVKQAMVLMASIVVFAAWSRYNLHPGPRLIWMQRPDGLAVGVFIALLNAHLDDEWMARNKRWMISLGTVGVAITVATLWSSSVGLHKIVAALTPYDLGSDNLPPTGLRHYFSPLYPVEAGYPETPWREPSGTVLWWWRWGFTTVSVSFAPAALCFARYKGWWVNRALSFGPLRYVGRMSYTLYVWHGFFFVVIHEAMKGQPLPQVMLTQFVVAFAIGFASYYGVERRVLRYKLRFASEREVVDLTTGKVVDVGKRDERD